MPSPPGLPFDDPDAAPAPVTEAAAPTAKAAPPRFAPAARPAPRQAQETPPVDAPPRSVSEPRTAPPTSTTAATPRQVLSVTELTIAIRDQLESQFFSVWVEGELSNCKVWSNGHLYFTLKDDRAQLKGVMFRTQLRYLRFKPVDGQRVIARGRVSVYEPKGEYQLTCEHLEPRGFGALQLAYEQLKKRLQSEGLFDEARKRPLPPLPPHHRHRHLARRRGYS